MKNIIMIIVFSCTITFLITGCGPTRLEMDYGTSFQLQKYNQFLNPDAGKNLEPVVGLSGQAAQGVLEKYQKGFEEEPTRTTTYQIEVGDIQESGI